METLERSWRCRWSYACVFHGHTIRTSYCRGWLRRRLEWRYTPFCGRRVRFQWSGLYRCGVLVTILVKSTSHPTISIRPCTPTSRLIVFFHLPLRIASSSMALYHAGVFGIRPQRFDEVLLAVLFSCPHYDASPLLYVSSYPLIDSCSDMYNHCSDEADQVLMTNRTEILMMMSACLFESARDGHSSRIFCIFVV